VTADTSFPEDCFCSRFALRYSDLDLMGHLNHAAYHTLIGEARAGFLVALSGQLRNFVLARVELDYLVEITEVHRFVDVHIRAAEVGSRSITLAHDVIRPDGIVSASGVSVMVAFDLNARSSRVISDAERTLLVGAGVPATPADQRRRAADNT
jgi:acyl-CoA thioester hydrolase